MVIDQRTETPPLGQIIARGFTAAHSVLLGALLLFLLHAPAQILNAVVQGLQAEVMTSQVKQPDPTQVLLYVAAAFGSFVLALAVFFPSPWCWAASWARFGIDSNHPGNRQDDSGPTGGRIISACWEARGCSRW
jgi:hypothetical protein